MEDFLSEFVYCHSGVPQGNHLESLFFIDDVGGVLRIFQHVSTLWYADDLKLFKQLSVRFGSSAKMVSRI
jgi:hypothetical protein